MPLIAVQRAHLRVIVVLIPFVLSACSQSSDFRSVDDSPRPDAADPSSRQPFTLAGVGSVDPLQMLLAGEVGSRERKADVHKPVLIASGFYPNQVTAGPEGKYIYAGDFGTHRIVRFATSDGHMDVVAGNTFPGSRGDGGPATEASLKYPYGIAVTSDHSVYFADPGNNTFRKVDPDGIIQTIATGLTPVDIGVAGNGDIYLLDRAGQGRLRRMRNGVIETLLEDFGSVLSFEVASDGTVYLPLLYTHRVWALTPAGDLVAVAGNGVDWSAGDGGPALEASFRYPFHVHLAADGSLYVLDSLFPTVRRIDPSGIVDRFAGFDYRTVPSVVVTEDGPATSAQFGWPRSVATDADGNVYVTDARDRNIRRVDDAGIINTFVGFNDDTDGEGVPVDRVHLNTPTDVDVHPITHEIYFADQGNHRIRRISADGRVFTVAGKACDPAQRFSGDGGPATAACLHFPRGIAFKSDGTLYIADTQNNRVRAVSPSGVIETVAGNGEGGNDGDLLPAVQARITRPTEVAIDSKGNLYIADLQNRVVRRVDAQGIIHTHAGVGSYGRAGDAVAPANTLPLTGPSTIAVGPDDTLYIADVQDYRIRAVGADGISRPFLGDGVRDTTSAEGAIEDVRVGTVATLFVDRRNRLYFSDNTFTVRRVSGGQVERVAGNTCYAFGCREPDAAPDAHEFGVNIRHTGGLVVTKAGMLVFTEAYDNRLRAVDLAENVADCLLDVDEDGQPNAARDAMALFRFAGNQGPLVPDTVRAEHPELISEAAVRANIEAIWPALDLDGDGEVETLGDLIPVYLYMHRASTLVWPGFGFDDNDPDATPTEIARRRLSALCPE